MVAPSRPSSALAVATLLLAFAQLAVASVFTCTGGTVYVVAHADDDLLFQSPDLLTDMTNNLCVTTVFLSAGDSGTTGDTYVHSRESGNEAATAQMAGVADSYTEISAIFGGQPVIVRTLVGAPSVQKVWFRLPDGNMDGSGFAATGYQSLRELYFGSISSITNQPKTATYTLATLKQAIGEILTARIPDNVRTLDYLSDYDGGDHADHLTTARIVKSLVGTYAPNAGVAGYMGYPVANMAPTMSTGSAAFQGKSNAFFQYTPYDSAECQSYSECVNNGRGESYWLVRQYVVTPDIATSSYLGSSQNPVTMPNSTNFAPYGACSASTQFSDQPAQAAIDGVISGYPGNASAEWSSYGQGVGATFLITWPTPYVVTDLALYDRPNRDDWMKGGTLTFADGSVSSFGALANDGSATLITLNTPVITDRVLLTVNAVAASTSSVGLAEFQAFGTPCPGCAFNSTSQVTITTTSSGFVLGNGAYSDLALQATATASSESPGQEASKVNNGVIGGYTDGNPSGYGNEWASNGELVGAWINLTWPAYYMVDSLVFYDRPNDGDWVTGGHVDFSDGSSINVPALKDDGSATVVNLTRAVNISSLQFTVTSVGPWSNSIGLSEISASYSKPQTPVNITVSTVYVESNTTVTSNSTSAIPLVDTTNDLALNATATASSFSPNQGPDKAIDGYVDGYKEQGNGMPYEEWASNGEKAGAWLLLTWPSPINITRVTLYDRPNYSDRILGGTFTWSDGTSRPFGALNADGSATTFTLSDMVTTSSLLMTVTSVSSTTNSAGLAEISAFGPGALVRNITAPVQLGNSTVGANLTMNANTTLSSNATTNATLTSTSLLPTSTGLNATASLNSTSLNATSTLNSTLPLPTGFSATSTLSANSSLPTLSANIPANATATLSANMTSATLTSNATSTLSANSTMPTLSSNSSMNATSTLSANSTMPTLSSNISMNATSTLSSNSSLPTLSATLSANASATLSANVSSATPFSNLTGIPASGSGYSTILTANGSSSALGSATASASLNATKSANVTSSVLPTASTSINSTMSSLASSKSSSASVASSSASSSASSASSSASSASSKASSASSSASSASSSAASSSSSNAASASLASVSSASVASVSSVSAASVASVASAAKASSASSSASRSSSSSSSLGSTSSMVVVTRSSSASIATSTSSAGPTGTAAPSQPTSVNIALFGKATASNSRTDSPPTGVNDGKTGTLGTLGWMSAQNTLPQWVRLDFTNPYLMKSVYLFGPDNTQNTPYSGFLTFSDNSPSISFGQVALSGTAIDLGPAGKTLTWIQVNVRTGYTWRSGTGLKEIKIFNAPVKTCGWWEGSCLYSL